MFEQQGGRCKTCLKSPKELKKSLVVDHNHSNGEVRGLLCSSCNIAIGTIKEDTGTLDRIKEYLTNSR
jgi:hypothetical protein